MQYGSPAALRQALDDRLRNEAENRRVDIQRLRRRAVFERMLVRLERAAAGRWVLKGGMALELRLGDRARATKDLDLVVRETSPEAAKVRDLLIEALAKDPDGDGFEFRVGEATALDVDQAGRPGWRFPIEADLAGRPFAQVRSDVVARTEEINATERLRLPGLLAFAGIEVGEVEAVDRAQHFAEKLHALTRTYAGDRPSTRVKDLPDLILLIDDGLEPGPDVLSAAERVFASRGTHPLPAELPNPPTAWEPVYALLAEELDISAGSLGEAMSLLRSFWTKAVASRKEEE
jgi:predicted nucleotidyltransferase component of viral defense system